VDRFLPRAPSPRRFTTRQDQTYITYQVLGSWSRPFAAEHVDNNLDGSPEDGMDYGFNDFQCRYYEHYQADVDFPNYAAEFQRWHDSSCVCRRCRRTSPGRSP